MRVLTRKAIADVTRRKGRTLLMILGIFIGVLGLTAINGANDLFSKDLNSVINTSFDIAFTVDQVPATLMTTLAQNQNVAAMQQRAVYSTTWHLPGHAGTTPFQIYGYADLQHINVGTLQLVSGRLPGAGEIALDTSDQLYAQVALGDTIQLNAPDGTPVSLRVVGLIRSEGMAALASSAQGYATLDEVQRIAPTNGVQSTAQKPPVLTQQILLKTHNANNNEQTFYDLSSVLTSAHLKLVMAAYITPQSLEGSQFLLRGLSNIFLILASMALVLTCLMILTTINNILTEQFKIIGTMKAIGGTRGRIIRSYLLSVSIYALIGTALGLVLGLFISAQVSNLVAQQTKVDLGPYQVSPLVVVVSLAAGLLAPIISALLPLMIGTNITVRQAMASYGISTGNVNGLQGWGRHLSRVPQTAWLGLRGVFRKPGRAMLTVIALVLSSAIFMTAQVANNSIGVTDTLSSFVNPDFQIALGPLPVAYQQLSSSLSSLPNVAIVEPFDHEDVTIANHQTRIFGILPATRYYTPHLVAGRWLHDHELNALVISDIAAQRLNVQVGNALTLTQGNRTLNWTIVGIVHDLDNASGSSEPHGRLGSMFTTLDTLDVSLRHVPAGTATQLYLTAHNRSTTALAQLRGQIQQVLNSAGLWQASATYALSGLNLVVVIYALFDIVAIVVALVGLLGLSNTLAAEVLERRQEIGILRSLGATGWRVSFVFWIEGLAFALIAWIPGILIGIPGGYALVQMLNASIAPVQFAVNPAAIGLTLLFILIVSFVASFAPALSASRVRIHETLRYE